MHKLLLRPVVLFVLSFSVLVGLSRLAELATYAEGGQYWPDRPVAAEYTYIPAGAGPAHNGALPVSGAHQLRGPLLDPVHGDPHHTSSRAETVQTVRVISQSLSVSISGLPDGFSAQDSSGARATVKPDLKAEQIDPTDGNTTSVTIFLPIVLVSPIPTCPTTSSASYEIIPIEGSPTDRPDYLHGDLNLSLRGYAEVAASKTLQDYSGGTDPNAPQMAGLFNPHQFPGISTTHQVNNWDWGCGANGCPGSPITNPDVTLIGLSTSPGQPIFIPERSPNIFSGNYKAMVLYAEEQRITLGYTRQDSVAPGYAVHIENVCVDPNLLALYREQVGPDGFRIFKNGFYWLPALRLDQALGTAVDNEIRVSIRDRGTFLDPRSRKDWWVGY